MTRKKRGIFRLLSFSLCVFFACTLVSGVNFVAKTVVRAEAAEVSSAAYKRTEGGFVYYDLLGLFRIVSVDNVSAVEYSDDGIRYEPRTLPTVARYVKTVGEGVVKGEKLHAAKIRSVKCSINCYTGEGPENLIDENDATYMNPQGKVYTIALELDGYYRLSAFRWYAFQGFYPYGEISVSMNGGNFQHWETFDFSRCYVKDPAFGEGFVMTGGTPVACKYILIRVTGGVQEAVATREFTLYGEAFTPDPVDPLGVEIVEKNAEGAYNTSDAACKVGDTFTLTARQKNADSVCSFVWKSRNPNMLTVDEFGRVTVLRGGKEPYYTIEVGVTAPDGNVYRDEIKVYIEAVANIAQAAEISWNGANDWYGKPTMAFDGIVFQWGNWVQPCEGVTEYSLVCDFKQQILFGKVAVYIGVNAPSQIEILGIEEDGTQFLLETMKGVQPNSLLTAEGKWEYRGLVFRVKDAGKVSTIYEIEIYNHVAFPISQIENAFGVADERGPISSGTYVPPTKEKTEPAVNDYGQRFEIPKGNPLFSYAYSRRDTVLYVLCGAAAAGSITFLALAAVMGIKRRKKKK